MFPKSQWKDWATAWSLNHRPQKNKLYRDEGLAGQRDGLLFQAQWCGDKGTMLAVFIRFSPGQDLERVRAALVADASLDSLPGKGSGRNKTKLEDAKTFYVGGVPEFVLSDGVLCWRRTFAWKSPKVDEVRGWVASLLGALQRAGLRHETLCEDCRQRTVDGYVVVNGSPVRLCTSCQQARSAAGDMAERSYAMKDANYARGLLFALGGVVAGAVVWAALAVATQRMFALVGVGIGALVAWTYQLGAGKVDVSGRAIVAVLSVVSVAVGDVVFVAWMIARERPDIGFNLAIGLAASIGIHTENPRDAIFALICGVAGAWVAVSALQKPQFVPKIEQAGTSGGDSKAA
jgi:hypothetical protein